MSATAQSFTSPGYKPQSSAILSNDARLILDRLIDMVMPMLQEVAMYASGQFDDLLLDDLIGQRELAREIHIDQSRIKMLIKQGKIRTYTRGLVRRSEVVPIIEATRRKPRRGKHPKAPKAK